MRLAALALSTLVLMGAKGCPKPCQEATADALAACAADSSSKACLDAQAAVASSCGTQVKECPKGQHWCDEHGGGCRPDGTACGPYVPPAKPTSCKPNPCTADKPRCEETTVHGNRSGDPSTWTEGVMVSCHEPMPLCGISKTYPSGDVVNAGCYHDPDGKGWRYRCGDGVTDVAVGPTVSAVEDEKTCPAPPKPPAPPRPPSQPADPQPLLVDEQLEPAGTVTTSERWGDVMEAVVQDKAASPGAWNTEQTCLSGRPVGPAIDAAYGRLSSYLRPRRAAQSIDKDGKISDCLFVARDAAPYFEGVHLFEYGGGCASTNVHKAVEDLWKLKGTVCSEPVPPGVGKVSLKVHLIGPNRTVLDATQYAHSAEYCRAVGFTDGRLYCAFRQEGDPNREACEKLYPVTWSGPGFADDANPALWIVPRKIGGTVTACAGGECSSIEVQP